MRDEVRLPDLTTMSVADLRRYLDHLIVIGSQRYVERGPGSPAERKRVRAFLAAVDR